MAALGGQPHPSQTHGEGEPDDQSVHKKRKTFDDGAAPGAMGSLPVGMPEGAVSFAPKLPSSRVKEKHSATEKRRRDRIAEGLASLREVVVPVKEREDQAGFLRSAADYIRQLQAVLQHFSDIGFVRLLPEEAQWNVRALLAPVSSSGAAAAAAAAPAALPNLATAAAVLPPAAQPGQLQPGMELPGLMAQLLHHMATNGPQAGQLSGPPMMDVQAYAQDPQQQQQQQQQPHAHQHLQQQQLYQQQQQQQHHHYQQLQALAQKAHDMTPEVPDSSAWEFDGVDPHQQQGQVQQPGQGITEPPPPIARY